MSFDVESVSTGMSGMTFVVEVSGGVVEEQAVVVAQVTKLVGQSVLVRTV